MTNPANKFRFHLIVDSFENDEAHVLDTKTGVTVFTGSVSDCHRYLQS